MTVSAGETAVATRRARAKSFRRLRRWPTVLRFLVLVAVAIIFGFPFYWVVLTSLIPTDLVFTFPPDLLPQWDWGNYATAWQASPWTQYFINTFIIAISTAVLVLITSVLSGYALATMNFRGKKLALGIIFGSLIMPAVVAIIPDYVIANSLHWLNSYEVQIIPWGASTFGIFLMMQFYRGLPSELWDAARMDGCSRLRFLWSIGVPLARPALATIGLFIFLGAYNSLIWPLVMTQGNGLDAGVQPIEVGVYSFIGDNGTAFNLLAAATVFTMAPVIFLFLLLQRTFVRGVVRSGIKG
ncbi:MAG: carbohydrate ABC transporter permease [Chloroflexota bacterium]